MRDRTAYRSERSTMRRPYIGGDLLPLPSPAPAPRPPPPWGSSPVPYLFGGIAAMLGVIALALLLLACSYWKLSGALDSPSSSAAAAAGDDDDGADHRAAAAVAAASVAAAAAAAKAGGVVVIVMAGEEEPSFLGVPVDAKPREAGIYKGAASEGKGGEHKEGGEVTAQGR